MKQSKTVLIMTLIFFLHLGVSGQEQYLQISSHEHKKVLNLKEGKRIRILTHTGQRIAGRYFIKDPQTIVIKGQEFLLSNIEKIKRDGILYHVITGSVLFLTTAVVFVVSYYGFSINWAGFLLLAGTYGMLKTPNILRGYKRGEGAQYRIITENYKSGKREQLVHHIKRNARNQMQTP